MSNRQLEAIRWVCFAASAICLVVPWWWPALGKGGWGVLLFFAFIIFGAPAAMLSLHLHGEEWFGSFKRPKR